MLSYICEWIESVAFYMVLIVALMQMIPGESYKKYIKFYAGLILILMMVGPILRLFGMEQFQNSEYQREFDKIQESTIELQEFLEEMPDGE